MQLWGVACENIINPLYLLQKRVVRIITNKEGYIVSAGLLVHSAPLFYETGLLNIYDIFNRRQALGFPSYWGTVWLLFFVHVDIKFHCI